MTSVPVTRLPRVRASELVGRGWLNTGGQAVTLADLRGKVVILDFWTFCCINCLHVLDELRDLEARHAEMTVIVGVHSPKFAHEADPVALAAAVERYEVHHPVLDDPELVTWQAFTARAWPTLVVVDPEGYVVAQLAGEGHAAAIDALVTELEAEHEAKGTLRRGDGPYVAPEPTPGTLRFPAKALALPSGNLLVADAGHHSLAEMAPDGETLVRRIGAGVRGLADGAADVARFAEPNGLCLVPDEVRGGVGFDVLVADTANHVLRGVRLADGSVTTVAGTGAQFMVGGLENVVGGPAPFDPVATYPARSVRLSSPWDVVWSPVRGTFVVAMAGTHTLWELDPGPAEGTEGATVRLLGGTMNEGLLDGGLRGAWFAQPSGLALDPADPARIWVADAETSALRHVDLTAPGTTEAEDGTVTSVIGQGLFDFGHRDGPADQALLQHPLGVVALPDGSVLVADTYNGAVRRWTPAPDGPGEVTTLTTGLAEPSGLVLRAVPDAADPSDPDAADPSTTFELVVVESAAHRLTRVPLPADLRTLAATSGTVTGEARRTARPVTDLAPGEVALRVPFTPAPGQKIDDRWGPATELTVSSTPPGLLVAGGGTDPALARDLVLATPAPGETLEGVLHVTARAASCDDPGPDADPTSDAVLYPACHLAQQDWGVPVRVTADGTRDLTLPLLG